MNNINNLGISMRNSTDIVAHSISLVKENKVVSLEDYITEIAGDGEGEAVDAYTKSETDALLNDKANLNSPDFTGTIRIDPVSTSGKLVVNAQDAPNDEDFYVNGLSHLAGTFKCQFLQASSNIETSQILRSDTLNTYTNSNITIQRHSVDYITLESDKISLSYDVETQNSSLKTNILDSWTNTTMKIRRNGAEYISLEGNDTIRISKQTNISSNKADGVDMSISHYKKGIFEKKLSFKNGNEIYATGDGGGDEELLLNYYTDNGVRIGNATDAYLTIKGARNGTNTLTVNGTSHFADNVAILDGKELQTNIINSNGTVDLVLQRNSEEFLRLQGSDNTVRVPNTKAFLSQDIFTVQIY